MLELLYIKDRCDKGSVAVFRDGSAKAEVIGTGGVE